MTTRAPIRLAAGLAALAIPFAVPAAAADPTPSRAVRAAVVQKLVDCRKLADGAQRLACYDAATAAFDQAEAKGDVVVVDREQARQVRRQAFGFQLPSISIFEKGETTEDLENTDGVLATARQDSAGRWTIRLEDGAVWASNGPEQLFKTPKPGMKVRIRKASLGSYLMMIDGQGGFKARRVE